MISQERYRKWLVAYGIYLAVQLATRTKNGATLRAIRDEMRDDGLLDGYEARGDVWLLDVRRSGPFEYDSNSGDLGTVLRPFKSVLSTDYAHPGPPPPLMDPPK
jgi:hypothetical protein